MQRGVGKSGRRMHADATATRLEEEWLGDWKGGGQEEEWLGDSGDEEDPEEVQRSNLETEQASWSACRDPEWSARLREPAAGSGRAVSEGVGLPQPASPEATSHVRYTDALPQHVTTPH